MADLRIGTATSAPAIGELKLGSTNISKIYSGSTLVWPIDVADVCGLGTDWTTINSTVTAVTSGLPIQIVYSVNDWNTAINNNTPAAAYYNYANSNTSGRGLYYNEHAVAVIQPPSGFRIPTTADLSALLVSNCVDLSVNPVNVNTLATTAGNWSSSQFTNTTDRGNSGLNIDAFGEISASTRNFAKDTLAGGFWWYDSTNLDYRAQLLESVSSSTYIARVNYNLIGGGYNIRFAK